MNEDQFVDKVLFKRYIGDARGIQGHHNSCYLDATVFGLFALSDMFDIMFLGELKEGESLPVSSPEVEKYTSETKQILWKGIVNPLRK